jgi:predicted Zn-dependent protease
MRRVALFGVVVCFAALAQNPASRQQAIPNQLAHDLERRSTFVTDGAVAGYVDRIAQKLAMAAGLRDRLSVKVIAGDLSAAFPGASVYIDTRLILTAANEAELAGGMAHLLGHIALWKDPPAHVETPDLLAPNVLAIPLIWYGGGCQRWSASRAVPMGSLPGQAHLESEADQLALGYMSKAGYDPGALADFFDRMLAAQKRQPAIFRPAALTAATRAQAEALRGQGNRYIVTTSEFSAVQHRLIALLEPSAAAMAGIPTLYPAWREPAIERDLVVIRDPVISDYVNAIAQRLEASAGLQISPTLKVIEGDDARAITLPGGVSYLTAGLILAARDEAELAGAIAHQFGHLADAPAGGSQGLCARTHRLSSPRDAEEQADLRGLEYMDKAGYDPGALADFYERTLPRMMFPAGTRVRAESLRNGRSFAPNTSELHKVQERLMDRLK